MSAFGFTLPDVGHATGRVYAHPLGHAGATSPAGGVPDAERPNRRDIRERAVRAGECQCCGALVPSAHRLTTCPLCGSPVLYRLNENAPAAVKRSGADTGGSAPMPDEHYRLAQDALDMEIRNGRLVPVAVPASCPCGDDLDGRMHIVRDRDLSDGEFYDTVIEAELGTEDGPSVIRKCWTCDRDIVPDVLVVRDRQRRCERALQAVA